MGIKRSKAQSKCAWDDLEKNMGVLLRSFRIDSRYTVIDE